jgi:hypothetical protein
MVVGLDRAGDELVDRRIGLRPEGLMLLCLQWRLAEGLNNIIATEGIWPSQNSGDVGDDTFLGEIGLLTGTSAPLRAGAPVTSVCRPAVGVGGFMITRAELRTCLRERLHACENVLAMWEAGSAAFGRADERSDLDIGVLARGGSLQAVWQAVEAALDDLGGFSIRWENPLHIFKE